MSNVLLDDLRALITALDLHKQEHVLVFNPIHTELLAMPNAMASQFVSPDVVYKLHTKPPVLNGLSNTVEVPFTQYAHRHEFALWSSTPVIKSREVEAQVLVHASCGTRVQFVDYHAFCPLCRTDLRDREQRLRPEYETSPAGSTRPRTYPATLFFGHGA